MITVEKWTIGGAKSTLTPSSPRPRQQASEGSEVRISHVVTAAASAAL